MPLREDQPLTGVGIIIGCGAAVLAAPLHLAAPPVSAAVTALPVRREQTAQEAAQKTLERMAKAQRAEELAAHLADMTAKLVGVKLYECLTLPVAEKELQESVRAARLEFEKRMATHGWSVQNRPEQNAGAWRKITGQTFLKEIIASIVAARQQQKRTGQGGLADVMRWLLAFRAPDSVTFRPAEANQIGLIPRSDMPDSETPFAWIVVEANSWRYEVGLARDYSRDEMAKVQKQLLT